MRAIVFGAGSIGGVLASRLTRGGAEVAVVARGAHLDAIRRNGLIVAGPGEEESVVKVEATDDPSAIEPGDFVLVTTKAQSLPDLGPAIAGLRRADGVAVFLQNGLPWWYFRGVEGTLSKITLPSLDPGGRLSESFPTGSIGGGAVYIAAHIREPGIVQHTSGIRLTLGSPEIPDDPRIAELGALLASTGLEITVTEDLRLAMWSKLVQNVAHNGVAMLTGANTWEIWNNDDLSNLVIKLADEASDVGAVLGQDIRMDVEFRRRTATRHKPSTLQDYEAGRRIEYEPLYGGVIEVAKQIGVEVPAIEAVAALMRYRAGQKGLFP